MFQLQFMLPNYFPPHPQSQSQFSGYAPLMTPLPAHFSPFGYSPPIYSSFGYTPYYNVMEPGYTPLIATVPAPGYTPMTFPTVDTNLHHSPYEDDAYSDILDAGDPLLDDTENITPQFFISRLSPSDQKSSSNSDTFEEAESPICSLSIMQTSSLNIEPLQSPLSIYQTICTIIQSSLNPLSKSTTTIMNIQPSSNRKLSASCGTTSHIHPMYLSQQTLQFLHIHFGTILILYYNARAKYVNSMANT